MSESLDLTSDQRSALVGAYDFLARVAERVRTGTPPHLAAAAVLHDDDPTPSEWRRLVFARDDFKCQECEEDDLRVLEAHHITPMSVGGSATDLENGITLCANCHRKKHSSKETSLRARAGTKYQRP